MTKVTLDLSPPDAKLVQAAFGGDPMLMRQALLIVANDIASDGEAQPTPPAAQPAPPPEAATEPAEPGKPEGPGAVQVAIGAEVEVLDRITKLEKQLAKALAMLAQNQQELLLWQQATFRLIATHTRHPTSTEAQKGETDMKAEAAKIAHRLKHG
jgi:hypothetical protein